MYSGIKTIDLYTGEGGYLDNTITSKGPEEAKFLISVPHAGSKIPVFSWERMIHDKEILLKDIDQFTDRIYDLSGDGEVVTSELYRNVVELNSNIKTNKTKRGVIPYVGGDGDKILIKEYTPAQMGFLTGHYERFHNILREGVEKLRKGYGKAFLLDGHRMSRKIRKLSNYVSKIEGENGKPDFCIGTLDGESAERGIVNTFVDALTAGLEKRGLPKDVRLNFPFKGGYIPKSLHNPKEGQNVIAVETNERIYSTEDLEPIEDMIVKVNDVFAFAVKAVFENCIKGKVS